MSEAEWLACDDPTKMLRFDKGWRTMRKRVKERKQRLFAVACCRRAGSLIGGSIATILDRAEQCADTPLSATAAEALSNDAMGLADGLSYGMGTPEGYACWLTACAAYMACERNYVQAADNMVRAVACAGLDPATFQIGPGHPRIGDAPAEPDAQAALLRDIVGNPFRPASLAPACRTPAVLALAQAAYDERTLPSGELDGDRLAVLADALEDAGATGDILAHLHGPGPHVRGCWALDFALGKE